MSETVGIPPPPTTTTTSTAGKPTVDSGAAASSAVTPSSEAGSSPGRGGRGRGRGRWQRRGRGRGRGRGGTPRPARDQDGEGNDAKEAESSGIPAPAVVPQDVKERAPDVDDTEAPPAAGPAGGPSDGATAQRRPWKEWQERPPRVKLTHFIALPLGHNPAFRKKLTPFTNALLTSEPAIPGLDASIVVSPRRMHFTLGVMSLHRQSPTDPDAPIKTLEEATKVLQELKPKILTMLNGERLRVSLDNMDIMKPYRGDPKQANVMWVGPAEGESTDRLTAVGNLIKKTFEDAGLLVHEDRPLKLHCTVVNTIYREPRRRFRQPFSYPAILASEAVKSVLPPNEVVETQDAEKPKKCPVKIDLGEWDIDEVQICEMGSYGAEGEYVAAARCPLL